MMNFASIATISNNKSATLQGTKLIGIRDTEISLKKDHQKPIPTEKQTLKPSKNIHKNNLKTWGLINQEPAGKFVTFSVLKQANVTTWTQYCPLGCSRVYSNPCWTRGCQHHHGPSKDTLQQEDDCKPQRQEAQQGKKTTGFSGKFPWGYQLFKSHLKELVMYAT